MPHARKAVFLDRDGVINVDRHYLYRVEDFDFVPGAVRALRRLQQARWALIVVTNQSGIGRGLYAEADYRRVDAHMRARLAEEGVVLDAVEHCPHLPDAPVARYCAVCECRKPAPGMLLRAAAALDVDLGASIMIGDKLSDVQAGRAAGVGRCWLVRTGQALSAEEACLADAVFDDLASCADHLLAAP